MRADFDVVFALYPDITQLDFTGPLEVLCRMPGARVTLASVAGGEVTGSGGVRFAGLRRLDEVGECALLCVPGGFGTAAAMLDAAYLQNLRRLAAGARYLTSVCTGSLLLGAAGLLRGRRAACHWAFRELLPLFGAIPDTARVVRDGNLFSGGGVTAGIDMALTVAAEIAGGAFAQSVQLAIEYAPEPPFVGGRPELASPSVVQAVRQRFDERWPERRAAAERAAEALAGSPGH
ncbi:MAG TPA: DJ-1/PfpI family protein [Steroidobacteraceae bacterium]|nr:DJ-1/PfpI family protein [Steroidobacteraceae bacterium]